MISELELNQIDHEVVYCSRGSTACSSVSLYPTVEFSSGERIQGYVPVSKVVQTMHKIEPTV